jgi:hypothetical protein
MDIQTWYKMLLFSQSTAMVIMFYNFHGFLGSYEEMWVALVHSRGSLLESYAELSLFECVMMDASLQKKREESVGDPEWEAIYSDEWMEKFSLQRCISKLVDDTSTLDLDSMTADNMFKTLKRITQLKDRVSQTLDVVMPVFGLMSPKAFAESQEGKEDSANNGTKGDRPAIHLSSAFEL